MTVVTTAAGLLDALATADDIWQSAGRADGGGDSSPWCRL